LIRTYIDCGVLIAAARGVGRTQQRALAVLADESRELVSSDYVRLEPVSGFISMQSGLSGFDAFHVIAAALSRCDELITTERPGKAIHRTRKIRVVSIAE
jgi:hypothetical protein